MIRNNQKRTVNGFLILDKPQGISSNRALQQIKHLFNAKKAGHTGSLDPLATGVLPLCFGKATKFSQYLLNGDKAYLATATLGIKTITGDAEGEVISEKPVRVKNDDIINLLPEFTGNISQIPPMYSALKHQGQPLYKLAREGKQVERKARETTINKLILESYVSPHASFYIHCSKGTYVRTLIEDIGEALGCGAHVSALRRIQAGPYKETQSYAPEFLKQVYEEKGMEALDKLILPLESAVIHFPKVNLKKAALFYMQQGQSALLSGAPASGLVNLYVDDEFVGIGSMTDNGKVAPKCLVNAL